MRKLKQTDVLHMNLPCQLDRRCLWKIIQHMNRLNVTLVIQKTKHSYSCLCYKFNVYFTHTFSEIIIIANSDYWCGKTDKLNIDHPGPDQNFRGLAIGVTCSRGYTMIGNEFTEHLVFLNDHYGCKLDTTDFATCTL